MPLSALPDILDDWRDVIHPAALLLPRPTESDYQGLKASIEERGVLQPLATYIDNRGENWIIDGVSRLQIMLELNMEVVDQETNEWSVPTNPYHEKNGDDPYAIALSLNIARRHLTIEQKRQIIRDLHEARPDLSDRALARMAGVSPHTVAAERRDSEGEAEPAYDDDDTAETDDDTAAADDAPDDEDEADTTGETNRQTRRQRQSRDRAREDDTPDADEPFTGTVLPSAGKNSRIAEVKRCVRHLRLQVDDLLPRSRRAA